VRFAEPISLREFLDRSGDDRLVVEKLAFQISNQINAVTPLTPAALACSVLLGAGKRALGETEFIAQAALLVDYAHERGIALTAEVEAGAESTLRCAAKALAGTGVIEKYAGGVEPVYYVTEKGRHAASYYRNTVIHFMLGGRSQSSARAPPRTRSARRPQLGAAPARLLKFEFFFASLCTAELERKSAHAKTALLPPPLRRCPRILLDFSRATGSSRNGANAPQRPRPVARSVVLRRCHSSDGSVPQDACSRELLSNANFGNA
jgi:glycerol-3-phosphate O-acyltransferase